MAILTIATTNTKNGPTWNISWKQRRTTSSSSPSSWSSLLSLSATPMMLTTILMMMMVVVVLGTAEGERELRGWHHDSKKGGRKEEVAKERLLSALEDLLKLEEEEIDAHHKNDNSNEDNRGSNYYSSPEEGGRWMAKVNRELLYWQQRTAMAEWNVMTNISSQTQKEYQTVVMENHKWITPKQAEGRRFHVENFDPDLQRQFMIFTMSATNKDPAQVRRMVQLQTDMQITYDTAKVCLKSPQHHHHQHHHHQHRHHQNHHYQQQNQDKRSSGQECLPLEPDLNSKMAESRDPEELRAVWEGWREVAGKPQKEKYMQFVHLLNQGARDNGYSDYSEYWTQAQFLGNTDLGTMLSQLWGQLRPLYLELQAYVRGRLRDYYGSDVIGTDGTIPAHLLGNMWAQTWENIFPLVAPFPDQANSSKDLDQALKEILGEDSDGVRALFELSEEFYSSMGLFNMTDKFWRKSMLEKPKDGRKVQCHASASDLFRPGDYRIKMCTSVSMEYLKTVHHEMGHVEYFMSYADQPTVYRTSPNQAFHEAVGDTTALSVMSRRHLEDLGLAYMSRSHEKEKDLNTLMQVALAKIAFLPFGLMVDKWRWRVFKQETTSNTYNYDWWKLRLDLQGLRSPVPRSEQDFDAAAKMHVPANAPYICYFVAHVAQFQFYKRLCQASGHKGPLHTCDFGNSLQAGAIFRNFMALGASQPWQVALEVFTGSKEISAQPLLEYFEPLQKWLKEQNEKSGESLGWKNDVVNWKD